MAQGRHKVGRIGEKKEEREGGEGRLIYFDFVPSTWFCSEVPNSCTLALN